MRPKWSTVGSRVSCTKQPGKKTHKNDECRLFLFWWSHQIIIKVAQWVIPNQNQLQWERTSNFDTKTGCFLSVLGILIVAELKMNPDWMTTLWKCSEEPTWKNFSKPNPGSWEVFSERNWWDLSVRVLSQWKIRPSSSKKINGHAVLLLFVFPQWNLLLVLVSGTITIRMRCCGSERDWTVLLARSLSNFVERKWRWVLLKPELCRLLETKIKVL